MRLFRNPRNKPSDLINTRSDLKILEEIAFNGHMTPTQLKKRLRLSYSYIQSTLSRYVDKGILIEIEVGRIKVYTFNLENSLAKHLYSFIREWPNDSP